MLLSSDSTFWLSNSYLNNTSIWITNYLNSWFRRPERMTWSFSILGPAPPRPDIQVGVCCQLGSRERRGLLACWPLRLALGMWSITSLIEGSCWRRWSSTNYIVGFTSLHRSGSGTKPLDSVWNLFFSGVGHCKRCWAGVGIPTSPWQSTTVFKFSQREQEGHLYTTEGYWEKGSDCCHCLCKPSWSLVPWRVHARWILKCA